MIPSRRLFVLGALGALCLVGCGDSGPNRQPLRGSITIDGVDLEDGAISFRPAAGTSAPAAVTSVEGGSYRFSRENGPMPGTYDVKINVNPESEQGKAFLRQAGGAADESGNDEALGPKGGSLTPAVDPKNRRRRRTISQPKLHWELQFTVPEDGSTKKDFELSR